MNRIAPRTMPTTSPMTKFVLDDVDIVAVVSSNGTDCDCDC